MFKEGNAEADLGLCVSVCWTCASDYMPASSWLELPPFLPCTNFMPFKLCWQRTWLFLLTAAASSGPMLLFTEKSQSFQRYPGPVLL